MSTHEEKVRALARYVDRLKRIAILGAGTPERSYYPPLAELLDAVGADLRPRRFSVAELQDRGAGFPDYGVFDENDPPGGIPRNVLEAKPFDHEMLRTAL